MIKPLLRIIPSYSGNIKIACNLSDYTYSKTLDTVDIYECRVRGAVLDSASDSLSRKRISCNLLGSTYDYDLKSFFNYNKDIFFSSGFQYDNKEIQKIDRTSNQPTRNIDVEYGCKRILYKKEGNQLEFFAPIYIDDISSLPDSFDIDIKFSSAQYNKSKRIKVIINEGETKSRNYNYLYTYLTKYLNKIDDKVATISTYSNTLILHGIDLKNGGMCVATDSCVSEIINKQNTINNFDATIASSFKRNNIVMKQVIPLAFQFNISDVLSNDEKSILMKSTVNISGHYEIGGAELTMFDFVADYDNYAEDVLKMDDNTGMLSWVSGDVQNLMDDTFPSLQETRIQDYQFSNKLTKMYSMWKLAQTEDDHPYIINNSFAFNRNQENNIMYGQYPKASSSISALAKEMEDDSSNYSLMFPLGDDKEYFDGNFADIPEEYKDSIESYQFHWFDVIDSGDIIANTEWGDVIQGKCYYKGILHDIDRIISQSKVSPTIDKFAIVIEPVLANVIDNDNTGNFLMPTFTILTDSSNYYTRNAYVNSQLILNGIGLGNGKANWIYASENSSTSNAEIVTGNIYSKAYPDSTYSMYYTKTSYAGTYAYLPEQYSRYIDPNEIGIDVEQLNEYYDGEKLCAYMNNVRKSLKYSNCVKWLQEDGISVTYQSVLLEAMDIIQSSIDPILCVGKANNDSLTYSYLIQGNELLSLHIPGILCNSYGYMKIDDRYSYLSNTYYLKQTTYTYANGEVNWEKPESTIYVKTNNNVIMNIKCGYDEEPDFARKYSIEVKNTYTDNTYIMMEPYVVSSEPWFDPIYDILYTSTSSKTYPVQTTYKDFNNPTYSYIKIPDYPYSSYISYQTSIYNGISYFVKRISIQNFVNNDVETCTATYLTTSSNYDVTHITDGNSKENLMLRTMRSLHDHVAYFISSYCDSINKYAFYPVMFNSGNPYIYNVFVKKNEHESLSTTVSQETGNNLHNILWIDIYNMTAILEEYKKKTGIDCLDLLNDKFKFKAKFLNKQHMYWWYTELVKDENLKDMKNKGENWSDHVYIKTKNLVLVDGKLTVKNCYKSIRTLSKQDPTNFNISFKKFYDLIVYDAINDKWTLFNEPSKYVEVAFDLYCIRVNKDLYGVGKLIDGSQSTEQTYKDLYIYRNETDSDWETNYINGMESKYINPDIDSLEGIEVEDTCCLIPLFNEIYEQELEDTQFYAIYKLEGLQEVKVVDDNMVTTDIYQRYSQYNTNCLIEIPETTLEYLAEPIEKDEDSGWIKSRFEVYTGKVLNNLLWSNLSNNNIGLVADRDDLNVNIANVNTISQDGVNYMYYKIKFQADNTLSTFDLNAKTLMSSEDNPNEKYSTFIVKYVKYINGYSFQQDPNYFRKVFREMLPFMKTNPNTMLSQITSIIPMTSKLLTNRYNQKLCVNVLNKQWQPTELTLNQISSNYSYKIERYYGDMVPYIVERASIPNQWWLKYKDVDTSLLETGKYNSIGDSCIEHSTVSISSVLPHYIYTLSTNELVKSYNNKSYSVVNGEVQYDVHIPLEYKHYNIGKYMLLPTTLSYTNPVYITYDNVLEQESYDNTMEIFKKVLSIKGITDDEYIFLYKLYDVSYDTTPVKLNVYKDTKLWRLKYAFELK